MRAFSASLALTLLLLSVPARSQPAAADAAPRVPNPESRIPIPDSPLSISLLTIGPGSIYWERFGHNAIVVRDETTGVAVAYNYGIFDFDEDDFLLNFARGFMRYRIAADPLGFDLDMYREEHREIVEQRLAFTPDEAAHLRDFLVWNSRPENAYYRYDYFLANCSTRVRDALDAALGGAIRRATEGKPTGSTFRDEALRLMAPEPALMLVIDLGLGPFADQPIDAWRQAFVPAALMRAVRDASVAAPDGATRPLVEHETTIERGDVAAPPARPPRLTLPFLAIGLAIAVAIVATRRSAQRGIRVAVTLFATLFEIACALGGIALLVLWLWTEHRAAWRNENLLLLDPLTLLLIPAAALSARRTAASGRVATFIAWIVAGLAAFALMSKALPGFVQANLHWIALILPIHVAIAMMLSARRPIAAPATS